MKYAVERRPEETEERASGSGGDEVEIALAGSCVPTPEFQRGRMCECGVGF